MIGGSGLLLLSAAAGYWVLERSASHNKGNLKRVGQVVGWFMILTGILGVVCNVYARTCPPGSKMCPFTPRGSSPQTQSPVR